MYEVNERENFKRRLDALARICGTLSSEDLAGVDADTWANVEYATTVLQQLGWRRQRG